MDIHPLDIVIHIVNILVLYILLKLILYKPVKAFMDKRTAAIQADLDSATKVRKEADALKAEFDQKLQSADDEVEKKLLEGTARAGEAGEAIIDQAKAQSAEMLDKARRQLGEERSQMVLTLQHQITDMAVGLAREILGREVSEADNQKVIDDFFNKAV